MELALAPILIHDAAKWTVRRKDLEKYPYSLDRPGVTVLRLRGRAGYRGVASEQIRGLLALCPGCRTFELRR
jgi:hypothetical protein